MVDPWKNFEFFEYPDGSNVEEEEQQKSFLRSLEAVKPFRARSVVLRMTSEDASYLILNGTLDFCYIDAQHGLIFLIF